MRSRLILVGMVAVLGVTLPGPLGTDDWFSTARFWMIARLAEWDSGHSRSDHGLVVVDAEDFSPRDVVPAAAHTTAPATFEAEPIDPGLACGIVDEFDGMAEDLDNAPEAAPIADARPDLLPAPSGDSIEMRLGVAFCRFAERWEADAAADSRTDHRARDAGTVDAIAGIFEQDMRVFGPSAEGLASNIPAAPSQGVDRPECDSIESLADCKSGIAEERNRPAEDIEFRPEDAGIRPARIRTFEPIEVPADLESGIAYELNRASEGLGNVPRNERADRSEAGGNDGRGVGKAVRLTREAAFAWMSLLTGPTPVEITSR
jgi:hypothetical protein